MIPKKIHYCWFGGNEKPKSVKKCIDSWKKYCPDYEIIEWNESNFNIYENGYTKLCYENKRWAFLSDYARLKVIYDNGGIYFDTDVEVVKSFDDLLDCDAFFGFENEKYVASGLGFGACKNNNIVKQMINEYLMLNINDKSFEYIGCPILNTRVLVNNGLVKNGKYQILEDCKVLPKEYLNPFDDSTGRLNKTDKTYSVHWYMKSALNKKQILRSKITRPFHRIFGKDCFNGLKRG